MPRKTRAHSTPSTSSESPSRSELFWSDKSKELYKKLNSKRKIWAKRKVVLDELDPTIRENFKSRGRLPLLEIDHPPSTALIGSSTQTSLATFMMPTPWLGVGYEV